MSAEALLDTSTNTSPLAESVVVIVPMVHLTVRPERVHWPVDGVVTSAEIKLTPASSVAVRTVLVVSAGPLLLADQS